MAARLASIRAAGRIVLDCAARAGRTRIINLAEGGGYRLKFPNISGSTLEAVMVNTGGGVAGGDRLDVDIRVGAGAAVTVTTATAERIYRSIGPATDIDVRLEAAPGASLMWMPQATILFSGARLVRAFDVDMASDARLLMAEAIVFGRIARGEIMGEGLLRDTWRVRRDGRLLFAESSRLDGHLGELLVRPGVAAGERSSALLLYVAPDAEDACARLRANLERLPSLHAISTWRGMLVLRLLAPGLAEAHAALQRAAQTLTGSAMPRAWGG